MGSRKLTNDLMLAIPAINLWAGNVTSTHGVIMHRQYSKVPEFWGKESPYHGDTEFLGTPNNHLELASKRPISPHVFEIDGKHFHYKMPLGAVSSIANRATGVALSFGTAGVALMALTGDVAVTIDAFKTAYPLLTIPAKTIISFPLIYHYLAAIRHFYWDHYKFGNQSDKHSPLEVPNVERSSRALLFAGVAASALAAVAI